MSRNLMKVNLCVFYSQDKYIKLMNFDKKEIISSFEGKMLQ